MISATLTQVDNNAVPDSPGVTLMPPTIFLTCLIMGAALEFLFPHGFSLIPVPLRILLGLGIGGAGLALMLVAHEQFQRIGTNVPTHLPATRFVRHGAYTVSRNPMYAGGSALFLGIGITAGSPWLLAAYIPLFLYLSLYVIPREEAYMARAFSDSYKTYCRTVRRWL
jgi:protein-S-isoprenylcysteine O-methyltransferase Ste14